MLALDQSHTERSEYGEDLPVFQRAVGSSRSNTRRGETAEAKRHALQSPSIPSFHMCVVLDVERRQRILVTRRYSSVLHEGRGRRQPPRLLAR